MLSKMQTLKHLQIQAVSAIVLFEDGKRVFRRLFGSALCNGTRMGGLKYLNCHVYCIEKRLQYRMYSFVCELFKEVRRSNLQ